MTGLTTRLRRRSAQLSALRDLETACTEANRAYARWSADPSRDHYHAYLAADARVSSARRQIGETAQLGRPALARRQARR